MDNTNNNHLSKPHDSSETDKDRVYNIVSIAVTVVILAAAAVFVIALFGTANKESEVLFNENSVEFTGQYGMKYRLSDIVSLSLEDTIPSVVKNLYGAGIGDVKKGDWEVEGVGRCRLFVMSGNGPFVVMETKKGCVIINYKDAAKTKSLYEDLLAWQKQ